ncbi:MAG: phage tail family protein [Anaerolineae bacterium]|nr:phage tail family protein [Anaerolineae bacterium]
MGRVVRFQSVLTNEIYTFPTVQESFSTNFRDALNRTNRIPGADGGYSEDGDGRSPSAIGRIQLTIVLVARQRSEMQALRDALAEIRDWGMGRLFYQPEDSTTGERWAWCKVNNISISEQLDKHTDLFQRVTLDFQAADPFWYRATGLATWGAGSTVRWNTTSTPWGGTPTAVSGVNTTVTLTNNGNAYTLPQFTLYCAAGQTITNPIIRRERAGNVIDEVRWAGTLVAGETLYIDCFQQRIYLNSSPAYDQRFTFRHAKWFRLDPGANTVRVLLANAGDAFNFNARFYHRYVTP